MERLKTKCLIKIFKFFGPAPEIIQIQIQLIDDLEKEDTTSLAQQIIVLIRKTENHEFN
jgi:hypothetical protein